jgi:hypothetical protein
MTMAGRGSAAETTALNHLAERLVTRYHVAPDVIDAEIALALTGFTESKVRVFVPVLVEREVVDHLRQIKQSEPNRYS